MTQFDDIRAAILRHNGGHKFNTKDEIAAALILHLGNRYSHEMWGSDEFLSLAMDVAAVIGIDHATLMSTLSENFANPDKTKVVYSPSGKPINVVSVVRGAVRRAFSRTPIVIELSKRNTRKVPRYKKDGTRHKIDSTEHLCDMCKEWKKGQPSIDHKVPVVDPQSGFVDFNTFIERMFCDISNLQGLCKDCHNEKTASEWKLRRLATAKRDIATISGLEKAEARRALKKWTTKKLKTIEKDDHFLATLNSIRAAHDMTSLTWPKD